jgi:hypothetical protein
MKWRERERICFMAALVTSVILFLPLFAFAGGVNNEPLGAEDYLIGVTPPPSVAGKWYFVWYTARDDKDGSNKTKSIAKNGAALDKINVFVEVNRFFWITPLKFDVGGFTGFVNAHAVFPLKKINLHVDAPIPPTNDLIDESHSGLGDCTFGPGIAWHHKSGLLHGITAVDFTFPTGQWNIKRNVNVGSNVYTISPVVIFTVFPPFYPNIDISMKFAYSFNTKNEDFADPTGLGVKTWKTPGQEFAFDYDVMHAIWGGKPGMQLRGGVAGYFYQQMTKDTSGDPFFEDHKGRVVAVGPALMFDYKNWIFSGHCYFEAAAVNRTQGIVSQLTVLVKF